MNINKENTKEVRPGLFIQDLGGGKYRRVYPLKWDGKSRIGIELKNIFTIRTFFTIAIIIFLAWSYQHDISSSRTFYTTFWNNPIGFCQQITNGLRPEGLCANGICPNITKINFTNG